MKIICRDNFGREDISDKLIAKNVDEFWGKKIVKFLNDNESGVNSPYFFALEPDTYKLYIFQS